MSLSQASTSGLAQHAVVEPRYPETLTSESTFVTGDLATQYELTRTPGKSKASNGANMFLASTSEHRSPPFFSRQYSHLPTPQSPNNIGLYVGGAQYTPHSPLRSGSPLAFGQCVSSQFSGDVQSLRSPSRYQQTMTPESSPVFGRNSPPHCVPTPPFKTSTSGVKRESPKLSLALAHRISPPGSNSSSDNNRRSHISSPFMARLSFADSTIFSSHGESRPQSPATTQPLHIDDVFSSDRIASMSTPPSSPSLPQGPPGGEMERIRVQMIEDKMVHFQEAESRRPEYLKRAKRSLLESDPSAIEGSDPEPRADTSVGIAVSPNKGRRLRLFQETSEESFEESLMAGGYGRYGAADWLRQPQPTPGPAGPSNMVAVLEAEAIPSLKELKKRKRLAAFCDYANTARPAMKLYPVQMKGKGRVLLDGPSEASSVVKSSPPTSKRGNRKKKGTATDISSLEKGLAAQSPEADRPNWPDSEFPWRLRMEERAEVTRAQKEDKLRWIERFLDRDTDEEDGSDEDEDLSSTSWGQGPNDPMPTRRGRGKLVPLNANPNTPRRRQNILFPSDPADARVALRSKKSVRALSYRKHQNATGESTMEDSDEVVCICNGRDDGQELVQCDACHTWYHLHCIGIRNIAELGKEEDPWYCDICAAGYSRTPSPELALSSEPTFVPTDDEPTTGAAHDLPFFQASLGNSPMTAWSSSRAPTTPTRDGDLGPGFSSGYLLNDSYNNGPSIQHLQSDAVRATATPGTLESFGAEESPFDPTSTPSRGIKFTPQFATPKNNLWSARASGLFQTPSKPLPGSRSRVLTGGSLPSSSPEETNPSALFNAHRNRPSPDESPIRRIQSEGRTLEAQRRLLESPLSSRSTAALPRFSLQESPVMHLRRRGPHEIPALHFSHE